ncbi:uncharacterized protein N7498_008844 [Penicillium cinerascens]|uniref:Uncharacterized protein n=1 Tax=Penicillium cinerascens TaxID=70096 RepID=A0A9W9JJG6_9EURO|nr:uncharacterized protein N7498_008844 [Penicillium cinerascens]KAJ5195406.1 hypothetical protein N7498_008844 [Penicillium cinerascens]
MDASNSPFSNLDLWCDWSGEPNDPVEVVVSVEVWCTPYNHLPVLNTRTSSAMEIVKYGINLKEAKPEKAESVSGGLRTREPPIEIREVREPSTPADQVDTEDADLPDEYTPSVYSDPDSTILRSASQVQDSGSPDPFYTRLLAVDDETPLASPNPRKRTAKAASLPDSVTDSERSYGGSKHKALTADSMKQIGSSTSKHSTKPSLIPRPVSSLGHFGREVTNNTLPVSMDYRSALVEGYRRLEASFPLGVGKENDPIGRNSAERNRSNAPSPETPRVSLGRVERTGENRPLQDCESFSTDVSQGSPPDMSLLSSSLDSPTSLDNADSSGGVHLQQCDLPQRSSFPEPNHTPDTGPCLILTDGIFHVRTPIDMKPAAYEVSITISLPLQKGRPRGWWELIVPGLPRLARNEHGYVYFRTPPGQGMEFRTTHFKRYSLVESCLMAQFLIPSKLVLSLRPCESRFYGFLKDFKVTQAIRAEVVADEDKESLFHVIKYRAVCSIDLIQRDFWAESCGFHVWIHGGPEGEYLCHLPKERRRFQTIRLNASAPELIGVSELQIICNPTHLGMFVLAWEAKVPRQKSAMWMPRIKASLDKADIEEGLQAEFEVAESPKMLDMVRADSKDSNELRNTRHKGASFWKRFRQVCFGLLLLLILARLAYRVHEIRCICPVAEAQPVSGVQGEHINGTPVEESVPEPVKLLVQRVIIPASMPLRDRIDYLLGWRGPILMV